MSKKITSIIMIVLFLNVLNCSTTQRPYRFVQTSFSSESAQIKSGQLNEQRNLFDQIYREINEEFDSLVSRGNRFSYWNIGLLVTGVIFGVVGTTLAAVTATPVVVAALAGVGAMGTGIGTINVALQQQGFTSKTIKNSLDNCLKNNDYEKNVADFIRIQEETRIKIMALDKVNPSNDPDEKKIGSLNVEISTNIIELSKKNAALIKAKMCIKLSKIPSAE